MNRKQQFITEAMDKIIEQGTRSLKLIGDRSICMYRGDQDCRCAIGHMIKDEHYSSDLEERMVNRPVVQSALFLSGWPEAATAEWAPFLKRVQSAHDRNAPGDWPGIKEELLKDYA